MRSASGNGSAEFDAEMAAPVEIEDPNWHRSEPLLKECEWKQGDSAGVNLEGRMGASGGSAIGSRSDTARKLSKKEVA